MDDTLDRLLDLDGWVLEVGDGFWVKIEARRVAPTVRKPSGINYSLCLFGPSDERLICYDNAHRIAVGSGPARKRTKLSDHVHKGQKVKPYAYTDAETLLIDFWADVDRVLRERSEP